MAITRSDIYSQIAEGTLDTNTSVSAPPSQVFVRMIVLEVISNPNVTLADKHKKEEYNDIGVTNMIFYNDIPRNTIIAKNVGYLTSPMFVFPFFPSHISLPCKVGESVWTFVENDKAFWFCKITESRLADDVNHTHAGHALEISHNLGTIESIKDSKSEEETETGKNIWYELRNGAVQVVDGERLTSPENNILIGEKEDIFEKLITETEASKLTVYESVPRFSKRPGDITIEGTNNTLIVLGNDRKDKLEIEKTDLKSSSGMIDIVAGRGQTKETYGIAADTTRIVAGKKKGEKIKSELNKSPNVLEPKEGEPDFKNDRSRILVSQRTLVDKNFDLDSYNKKSELEISDTSDGDAAIVIKTDKIRLIARSDVEIIVKGFKSPLEKSPDGQNRKDENDDTDKWASIIIKANGDIVMTPSKEGYIKLGSEKADLAVLCEKATKLSPGIVTCPAGITDTMGGIQGLGGPGQGQFATKVLLF